MAETNKTEFVESSAGPTPSPSKDYDGEVPSPSKEFQTLEGESTTDGYTTDNTEFETDASTWVAHKAPKGSDDCQDHYVLNINPYDNTAVLAKEELVARESLLGQIQLEPGTSGMIVQLFKSIDTDKSGEITVEDFDKFEDEGAAWKKIEKHFDEDSDGTVTMDEFRMGFKGFGIDAKLDTPIGFEAPHDWTFDQWLAQAGSVLNKSVVEQCRILGQWVQQFDGIKSECATAATKQEKAEDTLLMGIYLNPFAEAQVHKLYSVMDRDENGVLEAADFAVMSKNAETSAFWEELKTNFDVDGDECITLIEFKQHICQTVADRMPVGSTPASSWTWRQVLGRLSEWANRMVQQQCREIFDYFAFGEYGTADSESAKEAGLDMMAKNFGAGTTLKEPAFPGGEPKKPQEMTTTGFASDFISNNPGQPRGSFVPATFAGAHEFNQFAPQQPSMQPQMTLPDPQMIEPQMMAPGPFQPPPGFGGPMMFNTPAPTGPGAWWLPAAVFQMQDHMAQLDENDLIALRGRRDARYQQSVDLLRQMAFN